MIQEATLIDDLGLSRSNRLPVAVLRDRPHRDFRAALYLRRGGREPQPHRPIAGVALFEWISGFNGKALHTPSLFLDPTLDQYRTLYGQADRFQPDFFRHFVSMSFADRPATVLVTHSMAFVVIIVAGIRDSRGNSCRLARRAARPGPVELRWLSPRPDSDLGKPHRLGYWG
jgi:hypothetical protein